MKFNHKLNPFYFSVLCFLFIAGCGIFKSHHSDNDVAAIAADTAVAEFNGDEESNEYNDLETELGPYQSTAEKTWELLHTDLDLQFNWLERTVQGTAILTLKPYFYEQNTLILDARAMDIIEVSLYQPANASVKPEMLTYDYSDSTQLKISFKNPQLPENKVQIKIQYIANPEKVVSGSSGTAISDEKGIYFINHDASTPGVPRQLWTQGETRGNRCWFPTIDQPNQKHTQKITLTFPDTMVAISNGYKISRTAIANKQIKEVWEMKQPHSVYLTMIALGNWAEISDQYKGKPVKYYVEKSKASSAKAVFGKTPKMIEFFSEYTGIEFPWNKFDQVCVREFVSGAMENTTAVVHSLSVQDPDYQMEDYISHELFHQWFGDYATAESWSEISMNESFAKYGEYLWLEHEYGKSKADVWMYENIRNWSSSTKSTPLINYFYNNNEEQFDEIRYNKGASILHMLRNYIGDKAFRLSIKEYLTKFACSNATAADWQKCVEKVTGKNLSGFFNRWYYHEGKASISCYFDVESSLYTEDDVRKATSTDSNLVIYITTSNEIANEITLSNAITAPSIKLDVRYKLKSETTARDTTLWFDLYYNKDLLVTHIIHLNSRELPEYLMLDPNHALPFKIEYSLESPMFYTSLSQISNYIRNNFKNANSILQKIQCIEQYTRFYANLEESPKYQKSTDSLQILNFCKDVFREPTGPVVLDLIGNVDIVTGSQSSWMFLREVFTDSKVSEETKAYLALYSVFFKNMYRDSTGLETFIPEDLIIEQIKKTQKLSNYQLLTTCFERAAEDGSEPKWLAYFKSQSKLSSLSENQKIAWFNSVMGTLIKLNTPTEIYSLIKDARLSDENTYNNYKSLIDQFYSIETAEDGSSQVSVDGDGVAAIQNLFKTSNDNADKLLTIALKKSLKEPLKILSTLPELSESQRAFRDLSKKITEQP